ncbi:MAG TPA: sulfur relay protein DsrC [Desulfobulbaceae bacterium]|nr:sulfur relay protein DsrC [Desulfobulbaceae bacterium]
MGKITVAGKKIELDEEGFLLHQEDWDCEVAKELAKQAGIDPLDEEQFEIIQFMREYYKKFSSFPILNYVCKHIDQPKQCINKEFINPMNAWKIAGLPRLDGVRFVTMDGKNYIMEDYPG